MISRKVLLLPVLLMLSAGYATASPFVLTNNTTTDLSNALIHKHLVGITFSQVELFTPAADERVLQITSATANDVVGFFTIYDDQANSYSTFDILKFSLPYDLNFQGTGGVFNQTHNFFFSTSWVVNPSAAPGDQYNYEIEISSSNLTFNPGTTWTILGVLNGGTTWKFIDSGTLAGESQQDIVFNAAPLSVPEPSSVSMLVMGLGMAAEALRRSRRSR